MSREARRRPSSALHLYRAALALRRLLQTDDTALTWIDNGHPRCLQFRRANGWQCLINLGDAAVPTPAGQSLLAGHDIGAAPAVVTRHCRLADRPQQPTGKGRKRTSRVDVAVPVHIENDRRGPGSLPLVRQCSYACGGACYDRGVLAVGGVAKCFRFLGDRWGVEVDDRQESVEPSR